MAMTSSRIWLLATVLVAAAAAQPALAATSVRTDKPTEAGASAAALAAQPGHHGLAFAAKQGAKALIVEPDGRVIASDGRSDLVAPASIAERRTRKAIARLIGVAAHAAPVHEMPGRS
jgi:hypothetical protein